MMLKSNYLILDNKLFRFLLVLFYYLFLFIIIFGRIRFYLGRSGDIGIVIGVRFRCIVCFFVRMRIGYGCPSGLGVFFVCRWIRIRYDLILSIFMYG